MKDVKTVIEYLFFVLSYQTINLNIFGCREEEERVKTEVFGCLAYLVTVRKVMISFNLENDLGIR